MILDAPQAVVQIVLKFLLMLVLPFYQTQFNPMFGKVSETCPLP